MKNQDILGANLAWANSLKLISIFAVVLLHVSAQFLIFSANKNSYVWWAGDFWDSLTRWCVPVFIMISGYFLLKKNEPIGVFLKKRILKILFPFLFWTLFYSLWNGYRLYQIGNTSYYIEIIKNILIGKPYYHLWFIYMLPFLYAITPILRKTLYFDLKNNKKILEYFLLLCFILSMSSAIFDEIKRGFGLNKSSSFFIFNFLNYIGYYCLGGYIASYKINYKVKWCIIFLAVSTLVTILYSYLLHFKYIYSYLSVTSVISSISVFFLIKKIGEKYPFPDISSKYVMGIYLIHPFILDLINSHFNIRDYNNLFCFIIIPLEAIFVFICSLMISYIIKESRYINNII